MKLQYKVRFTDLKTGRTHVEAYSTAKRAKEVVALVYTRHAAAETDAEYIGVNG